MAKCGTLKKNNEDFYPVTRADLVFDGEGNNINLKLDNIANELKSLKLVAGDNNTIKLMLGDLELSSLTINGGSVQEAVYGNLVFDTTFLKIQPNETAQIGIKLDTKPTQDQVVTISESSDILTTDKTILTFTSDNYDTYQYITITVGDVSQSETISIIAKNSDELLTESGITVYVPAQGSEYNVDTTIPEGTYTVQASDFSSVVAVEGNGIILKQYTGTETNIKIPNTMNYNGVDYSPVYVIASSTEGTATFYQNTSIQYVTFDNGVKTISSASFSSSQLGNNMFNGCTSLIGVSNFPTNAIQLKATFNNCSSLKFVDNLDKLVNATMMQNAFKGCTSLEQIQDLSNMTGVTGSYDMIDTFNGCTNLKYVFGLPKNAIYFQQTFYECSNLEKVKEIPSTCTTLLRAFTGVTKLKEVIINALSIENSKITASDFSNLTTDCIIYVQPDSALKTTLKSLLGSNSHIVIADIGSNGGNILVTWGDSITSKNSTWIDWPTRLQQKLTDYTIKNKAISGEYTTSTSTRQGGNTLYVGAFTIPATCTATEIILTTKSGHIFGTNPVLSTGAEFNPVSINGVKGAITGNNGIYYFTRYNEGSEVTVEDNTEVISETSVSMANADIMIIYLGTNSGWDETPSKLVSQIEDMVNYFNGTKYIIMTQATGKHLRTEEMRAITLEVEALLTEKYPNNYLNIREYLINNGLTENALTATSEDNERIALGQVPAQLLGGASGSGAIDKDDTHYCSYGQISVCNAVYSKLQELGYIA